jgi:hypothetical protein
VFRRETGLPHAGAPTQDPGQGITTAVLQATSVSSPSQPYALATYSHNHIPIHCTGLRFTAKSRSGGMIQARLTLRIDASRNCGILRSRSLLAGH